ncbi:MAG: rod shape-determining protein [Desulforhopalus sp.]|nr:rod shape-determining protein [Desulforhopalus sp.]
MFSKLNKIVTQPSIAIDLGTANTRLYAFGGGKIMERPSTIRLVRDGGDRVADEYFRYINSTLVATPLRGGVIVDLKNAISLLKPLVVKTRKLFQAPVSLACAPTDTTEAERELLCRALLQAGVSRVSLMPEVWAAAIGAGLDVSLGSAQLLIDIGEGVTDLAVFRDGRIIFASALRTACSDIHRAIRSAIMARYAVKIYDHELERLTSELQTVFCHPASSDRWLAISGIDVVKRREVSITIDNQVVVAAMLPVIGKITGFIAGSLKKLPEKCYCEILESGICLTGGGACIEGIDTSISRRTAMAVTIAADPLHAVINGATQTLQYWSGKRCWWDNIAWPSFQRIN